MIAFIIYLIAAIFIGSVAGRKLKKTFAPDVYKANWYGYLVNQLGHSGLGVRLLVGLLLINTALFGEFLIKWQAFVILFAGYGAFEIHQNGSKWDMIEDTLFVVGYGAGNCLFVFDWIIGSKACGDINYLLILYTVEAIHLFIGIVMRVNYGKYSNKWF
jgi:hypothetical protein